MVTTQASNLDIVMESTNKTKLSSEYKVVRRKFVQSALKWSVEDFIVDEDKYVNSLDVGDLVNILRSVGFKLKQFENSNENDGASTSTTSLNAAKCKVEITCGHSGLKATLESILKGCRCPSVETAQIWEVCGSTPYTRASNESLNNLQEAGSNLVPPLPSHVEDVVRDILARVINIMSDQKVTDLESSTRSISSNRNNSHHRSLDNINISCLASRSSIASGQTTTTEKEHKPIARTVSSTDLPTCPLSPVNATTSAANPTKQENWSIPTVLTTPSPASNLTATFSKMSITEKNAIFYKLEFAKRSVEEAMELLNVKPLSLDPVKKKLGLEHTSTPTSRARRIGITRTPVTASCSKNSPVQKSAKKSQVIGSSKRLLGTPSGSKLSTPSATSKITPSVTRASVTPSARSKITSSGTKASVIPVPRTRTISNTSVSSTLSGISTGSTTTKKVPEITKEIKHKAAPDAGRKHDSIKDNVKTDVSTGSTSSTPSNSSKSRILKNVVRRVTRLSGGSESPQHKSKES